MSGTFQVPFWATNIRITQTDLVNEANICNNCFTDISTQEACRVTQKLDVDQMSERRIRILKDTDI